MTHYRETLLAAYRSSHYGQGNPDDEFQAAARDESYQLQLGDLLPPDRDARIVDLGCGSGFFLRFLKGRGYRQARGVDASPEQVAYAQAQGLPVVLGEAVEFLRNSGPLDAVVSTDLIEHLTKDEIVEFLKAALAALAPDGVLILQTPNASSLYGPTARYFDFTHETAFTENSLRQVLLACGFGVVSIRENLVPFGLRPRRLLRWLLLKAQRLLLKLAYTIEVGEDRPRLFGKLLIAAARRGPNKSL